MSRTVSSALTDLRAGLTEVSGAWAAWRDAAYKARLSAQIPHLAEITTSRLHPTTTATPTAPHDTAPLGAPAFSIATVDLREQAVFEGGVVHPLGEVPVEAPAHTRLNTSSHEADAAGHPRN